MLRSPRQSFAFVFLAILAIVSVVTPMGCAAGATQPAVVAGGVTAAIAASTEVVGELVAGGVIDPARGAKLQDSLSTIGNSVGAFTRLFGAFGEIITGLKGQSAATSAEVATLRAATASLKTDHDAQVASIRAEYGAKLDDMAKKAGLTTEQLIELLLGGAAGGAGLTRLVRGPSASPQERIARKAGTV